MPGETIAKTASGLAYLTEALIDMNAELQEMKVLLNKARKDRNEVAERARNTADPLMPNG